MLTPRNTLFVLVDVQEKLFSVMHERERLRDRLRRLVAGMRVLEIPIVWLEQIPEKMGPTIPELRELLAGTTPLAKASFSCRHADGFERRVLESGRKYVVIAGIEAHVCVYQTAKDLLLESHQVEVVADAVSSRTKADRDIGLRKIEQLGGRHTSVEMVLFELMRTATHPAFREILKIVK